MGIGVFFEESASASGVRVCAANWDVGSVIRMAWEPPELEILATSWG
jgi:hypothetical protein